MRRTFGLLITLALGLLVAPFAAEAQPAGNVSRIGLLLLGSSSSFSSRLEGFRQGLRDLGWVEGQQIALQERYAENLDQLPDLAAELVRLPVALILAWGAANALAAQQATTTIPREARGSPPNSSSCSKRPCPPSPVWRCCLGRWARPPVGPVSGSVQHRC